MLSIVVIFFISEQLKHYGDFLNTMILKGCKSKSRSIVALGKHLKEHFQENFWEQFKEYFWYYYEEYFYKHFLVNQ